MKRDFISHVHWVFACSRLFVLFEADSFQLCTKKTHCLKSISLTTDQHPTKAGRRNREKLVIVRFGRPQQQKQQK